MKQLHTIPPLYNKDSRVLILGSFPSVKSREQAFFYGHPQNRFWRVIADIFKSEVPNTVEDKKRLILDNRLALWDVIAECEITGSSDSSIKNVVPNDISKILADSNIDTIFVNGGTAEKYYIRYTEPLINKKAICLPSTSPANAAWSTHRLCEEWKIIKEYTFRP